ncbi:MAG: YceI family protein [Gemmatimonadetes bacterium]|nr:YceI family protein [Gemmatimonadota bacterium]
MGVPRFPLFLVLASVQHLSAQSRLQVDPEYSRIGVSVPIAGGLGRLTARFTAFDATILYDEGDVTRSSVKATIRAASIDTGSKLTDDLLRGSQFLAVDQYPEIRFESQHVRRWGEDYLAVGDLSIRAVTKKIALPFRIVSSRADGTAGRGLGASARAVLNWREYAVGSGWQRLAMKSLLGDAVTLEIELWTRPAPASPTREERIQTPPHTGIRGLTPRGGNRQRTAAPPVRLPIPGTERKTWP